MAIKVTCTCGQSFKAKDELAGKRARCPKCSQPLVIPAPSVDDEFTLEAPVDVPKYNPLEDILADEGVKHAATGPVCPSCSEPVSPGAVICIQCGFNLQTGEKVYSSMDDDLDDDAAAMAGMSETEKMLYKAEREIEDMPISAENQKFGDEGDSYIVAIVGLVLTAILVGLAIYIITILDTIENFNTTLVSFWVSIVFLIGIRIAVSITAFKERMLQGWLCLFVPLYTDWYCFTRGLWVPFGLSYLFRIIASGCRYALGAE